ncbi:SDR family oxidoreductase [Mycobacterium sp. GA-1199]|uniref:SDR family NAD(P)-dependent oxidoreductase n=1 Tax=Mycobacterium sp. GA-1199 TaxID=1772287 RepID=UPI001E3FB064|nr:SDR family oxidoreductase [Mycobacterium sp. GA-1199]
MSAQALLTSRDRFRREGSGGHRRRVGYRTCVGHRSCASRCGAAPLLENDYETYEQIVDVNLWGVINGTKEFLPHLIASRDGHLVNISSLNSLLGQHPCRRIARRNSKSADSPNRFAPRCLRRTVRCGSPLRSGGERSRTTRNCSRCLRLAPPRSPRIFN